MKKMFALIAAFALLLPVLSGCQSSLFAVDPSNTIEITQKLPDAADTLPQEPAPVDTQPNPTPVETPQPQLTRDDAINIALKDAGLSREQIQDLDAELDRDDGSLHYDVDFEKNDRDYDYEIDANTGKILKKQVPQEPESKPASSDTTTKETTAPKQISRDEAIEIALKHAGLSRSQVRDLDAELDRDDGTAHFDVDFEAGSYDYEYEIHATSGKILRSQKERD